MSDTSLRLGVYVLLMAGLVLFGVCADSSHAQEAYTTSDTLAAIEQASLEIGVPTTLLTRIVRCETGGTLDPYSVGRQGELGVAQLHPRGELRRFYAWQYTDPFSPYQSIRFLAQEITYGRVGLWSCG
jgi:hypothetical protein